MPIYGEFIARINRTLDRAIETAKGSTLNRDAWHDQVTDLSAIKRVMDELKPFLEDSLRHAGVAEQNAAILETLAIEQAESVAGTKMLGDNTGVFEFNDVGTVLYWLNQIHPDVLGAAWGKLDEDKRGALHSAIDEQS